MFLIEIDGKNFESSFSTFLARGQVQENSKHLKRPAVTPALGIMTPKYASLVEGGEPNLLPT